MLGQSPQKPNSNRKEGRKGGKKGKRRKRRMKNPERTKERNEEREPSHGAANPGKRGPSRLLQQIGMNFLAINSAGSWPYCLSLHKIQYFPFCYSWHNDKKGRNKSSPFLMKLLGILFFIGIDMTITILIPGLTQESHSNMNLSMATSPTLHTKTILTV